MRYQLTVLFRDQAGTRVVHSMETEAVSPPTAAEHAWVHCQNDSHPNGWRGAGLKNGERSMMVGDLVVVQTVRDPDQNPWTVTGAIYEVRSVGFAELNIERAVI